MSLVDSGRVNTARFAAVRNPQYHILVAAAAVVVHPYDHSQKRNTLIAPNCKYNLKIVLSPLVTRDGYHIGNTVIAIEKIMGIAQNNVIVNGDT